MPDLDLKTVTVITVSRLLRLVKFNETKNAQFYDPNHLKNDTIDKTSLVYSMNNCIQ